MADQEKPKIDLEALRVEAWGRSSVTVTGAQMMALLDMIADARRLAVFAELEIDQLKQQARDSEPPRGREMS